VTTEERWAKAQKYERDHWAELAQELAASAKDLSWYEWRAKRLTERLASHAPDLKPDEFRILEVGSGPVGTVTYMQGTHRCAIDPLSDFYGTNPSLIELRTEQVQYDQGSGEELPYSDGEFNAVIIDNVIDHTHSPGKVMSEIHRVLVSGGALYFSVNVHTQWGLTVRRMMERFQLDKGHPHSYTPAGARALVEAQPFDVVFEDMEDFKVARQKELEAARLRNYGKIALGIYDVIYEVIALRR